MQCYLFHGVILFVYSIHRDVGMSSDLFIYMKNKKQNNIMILLSWKKEED